MYEAFWKPFIIKIFPLFFHIFSYKFSNKHWSWLFHIMKKCYIFKIGYEYYIFSSQKSLVKYKLSKYSIHDPIKIHVNPTSSREILYRFSMIMLLGSLISSTISSFFIQITQTVKLSNFFLCLSKCDWRISVKLSISSFLPMYLFVIRFEKHLCFFDCSCLTLFRFFI